MPVTIAGLPIHVLLVHAVVVLVPLMAIATAVAAIVPKWRDRLLWITGIDAVMMAVSLLASNAGERLLAGLKSTGAALPEATNHGVIGHQFKFFVFGLVAASFVAWLVRTKMAWLGIALTVVAGIAVIGWTIYTGDTGARAVWGATMTGLHLG
jgi:hypothetical protein